MIYTTTKQAICVYDRKSPRHNWQLLVSTNDLDHARNVAAIEKERAGNTLGWEKYQQQIARMHFVDGVLYDNLPSNYRWVCPDSTEPDLVWGTVLLEN
jgi:hypothetical protein